MWERLNEVTKRICPALSPYGWWEIIHAAQADHDATLAELRNRLDRLEDQSRSERERRSAAEHQKAAADRTVDAVRSENQKFTEKLLKATKRIAELEKQIAARQPDQIADILDRLAKLEAGMGSDFA